MVLGAVLGLTACTQYWAKPGGTSAEFEATKAACTTQAYGQLPPIMQQVQISGGYTTPMQTSCSGFGNSVNCFTTGGQYIPPASVPIDVNQGARNSAVRSCLMMAGWQPVKDRAEAEAIAGSASTAPAVATVDPATLAQANDKAKKYCGAIFAAGSAGNPGMQTVFGNYNNCVSIRTREMAGTR